MSVAAPRGVPPLPVDRGEAVVDAGQAVADRGGQGLAVGRERQRARQALEQRPPERVLEPPDPLAHGPLRHAQLGGGAREAEMAGGRLEGMQIGERRAARLQAARSGIHDLCSLD